MIYIYRIYTDINFIGMDQFTASGAAFFSVKPGHGVATRLGFAKTKFEESDVSKDRGDGVPHWW